MWAQYESLRDAAVFFSHSSLNSNSLYDCFFHTEVQCIAVKFHSLSRTTKLIILNLNKDSTAFIDYSKCGPKVDPCGTLVNI